MAARQKRPVQSEYVYGNTVRKMEPSVRTPREERREYQRQQRVSRAVRRNQEKALQIDLPYVLLLTAAALCALYICIGYLQVQSTITSRIYHIEQLEQELEQLKQENDTLQTRINTNIDLDYIYRVATEELGMVYANKNQVLIYDKTESEYVRQYEDIPGQ
ncbi:MAG: septum formation initiator family protein [Clostridiales bacterium]|nr:septum formation initiator family protein [Clostridiales bacterium]